MRLPALQRIHSLELSPLRRSPCLGSLDGHVVHVETGISSGQFVRRHIFLQGLQRALVLVGVRGAGDIEIMWCGIQTIPSRGLRFPRHVQRVDIQTRA